MRPEDAVPLIGIAISLYFYVIMALAHLPPLLGGRHRLPARLRNVRTGWTELPGVNRSRYAASFVFWALTLQSLPVVFLLAFMNGSNRSTAILGAAGAITITASLAWTIYLALVLRNG